VSVTDTSAIREEDPRLDGRAVKRIVYDAGAIHRRVSELGAEITAAYPDGDLLVLGLLKGSFIFLSDLVRHITRPLQVDFLVASSYGDAMESSGVVRLLYDPETERKGIADLIVAKHRNGPIGTVHLRFFDRTARFADLELYREPDL